MISDGCFLQYLQFALMPISSCQSFVVVWRISEEFAGAIVRVPTMVIC